MNRYFYNGKVVQLEHVLDGNCNLGLVSVIVGAETSNQTCFQVNMSDLQPLAQETFPMGSSVKYIKGSYTGEVVGYELCKNRVVTRSHKIGNYKNDRTRYSYAIDELEHVDNGMVRFEIDKYYAINGVTVRAMRDYDNPGCVHLLSARTNYNKVPRNVHKDELRSKFGILNVQRVKD